MAIYAVVVLVQVRENLDLERKEKCREKYDR